MAHIELLTKLPVFFSGMDEEALFAWLSKIEAVLIARGEGRFLCINVSTEELQEDELRELIALFRRFELDMTELHKLDLPAHSTWFRNPKAYWHDRVFKK